MSDGRKSFANNGMDVENLSQVGCHPGIPWGEDLEEQNAQFMTNPPDMPAARCIRKAPPSPDPANGSHGVEIPLPVLGSIIERPSPPAGAVRPPNYAGNSGRFLPGGPISSSNDPAKCSPSPVTPVSSTATATELEEEISRENEAYLASLPPEEILAEQERLRQVLPTQLYQRWSAKK